MAAEEARRSLFSSLVACAIRRATLSFLSRFYSLPRPRSRACFQDTSLVAAAAAAADAAVAASIAGGSLVPRVKGEEENGRGDVTGRGSTRQGCLNPRLLPSVARPPLNPPPPVLSLGI